MTKREALKEFWQLYPVGTFAGRTATDHVARAKTWNEFTSLLYGQGRITPQQRETWTNPFKRRKAARKKSKPKPKGWRVLKHGSLFAIVDERDDLIADVYSNQSDALTMAASRELREACEEILKADNSQKWGTAWIKILAAAKLARRGAK